jgi:hypothetical protein
MMEKKKHILFVCGSMNQTTQMHKIARMLPEYEHAFTPYYCDGYTEIMRKLGLLEFTVAGSSFVKRAMEYLETNDLELDYQASKRIYDLVVNCSDLNLPKNIRRSKNVLIQEGMTDPENFFYYLWKLFPFFPRWIASTSTFGLSDQYEKFCVASPGYRDFFIRKGCKPEKIVVTGIPNFDNCVKFLENNFPYTGYVLVCTSDARETLKYENRKELILRAKKIADNRQVIFKLHPNERFGRAIREIERYAPGALVFTSGSAEEMIANCDVLITRFSSTIYVGLALGKEVYSDFDIDELRKMVPIQNNSSAQNIANICREVLENSAYVAKKLHRRPKKREVFNEIAMQIAQRKMKKRTARKHA